MLTIDLGFRTGWARLDGRTEILDLSGHDGHGRALAMYHDRLDGELTRDRPVALAVERAIFIGRMQHADLTLAMIRVGHMIAWSHDVPHTEKTAQDVRGGLVGKYRGPRTRRSLRRSMPAYSVSGAFYTLRRLTRPDQTA